MKTRALFFLNITVAAMLVLCACAERVYLPSAAGLDAGAAVYSQSFGAEETLRGNQIYAAWMKLPPDMDINGLRTENTLTLSPDGTYGFTKTMVCAGTERFSAAYAFTGTYILDGGGVTLSPPQSVTASIDWGTLEGIIQAESGVFTGADSMAYRRAFNSPFLGEDIGNNEMYITINETAKSFEIAGSASAQSRYITRNLNTARGGITIYGTLILPAGYETGELPVVIFAHGFAGNGMIQQDVAYMLAEYGIASYCFDFCGGSLSSRSGGNFYEMSMLTEADDLDAVIGFIKEQAFTDKDNIYIFGESMGGAVAAICAARRGEQDVKGLLQWYPAFSISEQTRAVYPSDDAIPERAPTSSGISVAKKFYADARSIDIYPEISRYTGLVLMFQGNRDTVVPMIYVEKALDCYEDAELVIYDGEGHGFSRAVKLKAVARMIDFILENL